MAYSKMLDLYDSHVISGQISREHRQMRENSTRAKLKMFYFSKILLLKVNKNSNIKCEIIRYVIEIYLKLICREIIVCNEV